METKIYIEGSPLSPEVDFNISTKQFVLRGRSMPENAEAFYMPLITWLKDNLQSNPIEANFDVILDYYNTGSFIRLMTLFNTLHELNNAGCKFTVRWICETDDEDNVADGESFKEVVKIPFKIIEL